MKKKSKSEPLTDQNKLEKYLAEEINIPKPPSRFFEVGEAIILGGMSNPVIKAKSENNLAYIVECDEISYGKLEGRKTSTHAWYSIHKLAIKDILTDVHVDPPFRFQSMRGDIGSLLALAYGSEGINMNPVYQRELVWDDKDRELLLDSIFHGRNIGKFVFRRYDFHEYQQRGFGLEVVDGKQRLNTILAFYEGKISFRGKFFQDLSLSDNRFFDGGYAVDYSIIDNLTDQKTIDLFLFLNKTGRPVTLEHLDKIEAMVIR